MYWWQSRHLLLSSLQRTEWDRNEVKDEIFILILITQRNPEKYMTCKFMFSFNQGKNSAYIS